MALDQYCFFFKFYAPHRYLHVKRHSFPTRRSSDLLAVIVEFETRTVVMAPLAAPARRPYSVVRSEEHTSELQSPLNISYAVLCLKKKKHIAHVAAAGPDGARDCGITVTGQR